MEEDKRRREDGPKAKFHWMRRGVERWFSYSPEDVLMSRGRQEERLPRWELFFCYSRASAFLGKIGACNRSLSNALLREEGLIIIDQDLLSFYVSLGSVRNYLANYTSKIYMVSGQPVFIDARGSRDECRTRIKIYRRYLSSRKNFSNNFTIHVRLQSRLKVKRENRVQCVTNTAIRKVYETRALLVEIDATVWKYVYVTYILIAPCV